MNEFGEITLEMSLKPFKVNSDSYIEEKTREVFLQWQRLLKHGRQISVLLWIGDGSELLEYRGDLNEQIEWGRYVGGANPWVRKPIEGEHLDPNTLHARNHLYIEDPPVFAYADVARIVSTIKRVGLEVTGKEILVGETFDPGPEFAVSEFKYERHPEVCLGVVSGYPFIGCYATLHADSKQYAAFPDGIIEGTSFGDFFGRQAQCFLSDLGFDYIWFSNGLGFGIEPWATSGAVFDGAGFDNSRAAEVKKLTLEFWRRFREGCDYPIRTRGTNMATGIDLSSDAVPLREIYETVTDLQPPPNSPWVSLDGDFGLELGGWMSHIVRTPGREYPFRFYTHDPWWANSPWLDRYERYPHDIHMPMSVSRIDADGNIELPSVLEFLSIDDSFGRTPDQVPNEVIPEILYSRENASDAPGPLVWVYPFDHYHDLVNEDGGLEKVFFGDWYIRGAINRGLPLNTVVDHSHIESLLRRNPRLFSESILVIPVLRYPDSFFTAVIEYLKQGGKALFYGSLCESPDFFREFLSVELDTPLSGEFEISKAMPGDTYREEIQSRKLMHPSEFSDGGVTEKSARSASELMTLQQGDEHRTYALYKQCENDGAAVWVRGSNSFVSPITTRLPVEYDPRSYVRPSVLMRHALAELGYDFGFESVRMEKDEPVQTVCRHRNGFRISGFLPNTSSTLLLRFPWGVPILTSTDPEVGDDRSRYRFERAYTKECRIFLEKQVDDTVVRCNELPAVSVKYKRRLLVRGLLHADLLFFPEHGYDETTTFYRDKVDSHYRTEFPLDEADRVEPERIASGWGTCLKIRDFTGALLISW